MKVKLKTRMASDKGNYAPDSIIDLPEKEALELIKNGYAEEVETTEKKVTYETTDKKVKYVEGKKK